MRYKLGLCMGNGAPPALVTCIMPKMEKVTGNNQLIISQVAEIHHTHTHTHTHIENYLPARYLNLSPADSHI